MILSKNKAVPNQIVLLGVKMQNILLLTATVTPPHGAPQLLRSNPSDRLDDYRIALRFYCRLLKRNLFDSLLVAENSNSEPTTWKAVMDEEGVLARCEFLSFDRTTGGMNPSSRFASEIRLIKQAIEQSQSLRANPDAVIWKVTGRYIIQNLEQIVRTQPASFDLYVNCRNVPSRWLDFFVVGFRWPVFFHSVCMDLPVFEASIESGESILRRRIDDACYPDLRIAMRMDPIPRVAGIRGVDEVRYHGIKLTAKHYARVALNRVAPWLWV